LVLEKGARPVPSKQLAVVPYPTKSAIVTPLGQPGEAPLVKGAAGVVVLLPMATVPSTNATLPAVALKSVVPVASGVGNATPFAPPEAAWTRKYWPGASVPEDKEATTVQVAPVAGAYCTE